MLIAIQKVLFFPFYLVMHCIQEISGKGSWHRHQRRRMESDRPPLSDVEFLRSISSISPGDESHWLAVRRAVAESIGLPTKALHPQDQLKDLWRMQLMGPDDLDIVFRLESILGFKIPIVLIRKFTGDLRYGQAGEFQDFAEAMVRGLHEMTQTAITKSTMD